MQTDGGHGEVSSVVHFYAILHYLSVLRTLLICGFVVVVVVTGQPCVVIYYYYYVFGRMERMICTMQNEGSIYVYLWLTYETLIPMKHPVCIINADKKKWKKNEYQSSLIGPPYFRLIMYVSK